MNNSSNVFRFHGNNMIVHAKGPNIDRNISTSFRSNLLSSTMNLPRNFERQGYAESLSSQRSMFYGRELSPTASVRSDFQPRNFHKPFNQGYSQRSAYSGRGGSPNSMRSIDSTTSEYIDEGFKNGYFNKHERRIIQELVNNNRRRRAKKMRKRNSSGDSSSMSSDDCMSIRTGYSKKHDWNFKENVPQSLVSVDSRSIETNSRKDIKDIRDTREYAGHAMENPSIRGYDNMLSFQKNMHSKPNNTNHKNKFSSQSNVLNEVRNMFSQSNMNMQQNEAFAQRNTMNTSVHSTKSLQNSTVQMPKDRFKSGFQFSSQRFNKSVTTIEEHNKTGNGNISCNNSNKRRQTSDVDDNSSEDETIFLDTTRRTKAVSRNNNTTRKRNVDCLDEVPTSAKKKCKTTLNNNNKAGQKTKNIIENEFVFAKPQVPVRKKPIEKLISKSAEPFSDIAFNVPKNNTCVQAVAVDAPSQEKEAERESADTTQLTNTDLSMRPSFRKRKLFTQTLDITERKNNSSESLSTDSPQSNIYSGLSREKHKTRKLATSQSLLSRDVSQDDNNLLDLIQKIVPLPPSQVTNTNVAKPSHTRAGENNSGCDGDDKWDITSILSTCNNDSVSDTYTDDEIFKVTNGDKINKTNKTKENGNHKQGNVNSDNKKTNEKLDSNKDAMSKCNVVLRKLTVAVPASTEMKSPVKAGTSQKTPLGNSLIDAFWNTDSESDYEYPATPHGVKEKYLHGTTNNKNMPTPKQTSIKSFLKGQNSSANKISKNTKTLISSVVVNKNDTTLVKSLKKQTNTKNTTKPSSTSLKATNCKGARPEQSDKLKNPSTVKMVKTRRQTKNLSAVEESCIPKDHFQTQANGSEANSKQNNLKKGKEKIAKTQLASESTNKLNRNINKSQSQAHNPEKPKLQKNAKRPPLAKTKVQDEIKDISNCTISKVLRSRIIDLSSSFNSDKFELTGLSRPRKSRTPSRRISFNKSRNATNNKCRNKK